MKIAVVGATGLIGAQVVRMLRSSGHDVVEVSASEGVDVAGGVGLDGAFDGVQTVVDVLNAMIFDEAAVVEFFSAAERNLAAAETEAGVGHHVVLSIVGTDRVDARAYLAGKLAQEKAVAASGIPYTIVRATQFFEFMSTIAGGSESDGVITVTSHLAQPVASAEVAAAVASAAESAPLNGATEIAGPERAPLAVFVERQVRATGGTQQIVADAAVGYFGVQTEETSLVPVGEYARGAQTQTEWLAANA